MSFIEAKMNRYGIDASGSKSHYEENLTNDIVNTTMQTLIQNLSTTEADDDEKLSR
jgi:hypothetical protein